MKENYAETIKKEYEHPQNIISAIVRGMMVKDTSEDFISEVKKQKLNNDTALNIKVSDVSSIALDYLDIEKYNGDSEYVIKQLENIKLNGI